MVIWNVVDVLVWWPVRVHFRLDDLVARRERRHVQPVRVQIDHVVVMLTFFNRRGIDHLLRQVVVQ